MLRRLRTVAALRLVSAVRARKRGDQASHRRKKRAALLVLLAGSSLMRPRSIEQPRFSGRVLSFVRLRADWCWNNVRFRKSDIQSLKEALRISAFLKVENCSFFAGEDSLLFLLHRYAYPGRFSNLEAEFRREYFQLSCLFRVMMDQLYERSSRMLLDGVGAWADYLPAFAAAVNPKTGAPTRQEYVTRSLTAL
ncbi:unnamed protein product [Phaeothamnion confervicola]